MCGRYSLTADPMALRPRFGIDGSLALRRRWNIAPQDRVAAVLGGRGAPAREAALVRWGLVPRWARDPAAGARMINARAETAAELPAFRESLAERRCLVLADGFYEWRAGPAGKQAHWITRADREPFAFAGIWDEWRGGDDGAERTCAILTTRPSATIAPIHDRMPVMLAPDAEGAWLDPDASPHDLAALLAPWPDALTDVTPVGPAVNDARYDGPECVVPAPVQDALF